uniref:M20/M25/M40 family metallo-hydrolase n=1 Tax=Gemmiger formicilis TaxID=745368 RepID=UPI004026C555
MVGILGEYDALPSLSQKAGCPHREELVPGGAGHGCGHNLLGVGAAAAAVAVKDCIKESGLPGTIAFYGCPAEENGSAAWHARPLRGGGRVSGCGVVSGHLCRGRRPRRPAEGSRPLPTM